MPYRRLPNTDLARIRALQNALSIAKHKIPTELAFSQKLLQKLRYFTTSFEHTVELLKQTKDRSTQANILFLDKRKKAKIYISHFIQVINLAIIRDELKPEVREYFKLPKNKNTVPQLSTNQDILEWGEKIIQGESTRIQKGKPPIVYNPSIAVVKIYIINFKEVHAQQIIFKQNNERVAEQLSVLRKEADLVILDLWNEIEEHFKDLSPDFKRKKCNKYGVVYCSRKKEKENQRKIIPFMNHKLVHPSLKK